MVLRIMRVFRVLRISRVVQHVHSLKAIINTLANSFVNVLNISVLLFLVFFVYAVIGMQIFGYTRFGDSLNEDNNFRDFGNSLLVLCRPANLDLNPNPNPLWSSAGSLSGTLWASRRTVVSSLRRARSIPSVTERATAG